MPTNDYVLKLSCPSRQEIAAIVSAALSDKHANILEAQQFDDTEQNRLFMRVVFRVPNDPYPLEELRSALTAQAGAFVMDWSLVPRGHTRKVMILVSRFDHCLVDLLYRKRIGELPMDITAVVTNHSLEHYSHLDLDGTPIYSIPITRETNPAQEEKLAALIEGTGTELIVLARYMQVLSPEFSAKLHRRCINIHHSFLPGFKGAKPYHQAYERGVKLIGATAHYVTNELDEGPIIEQDVERISHFDTPDNLVRKGRDIERRVLARAIRYHLDDRVLLNGRKTVVFPD
ncbi:MAG: formyltetrahydrofolate deformylase [Candidatus Pacebacteria bacterium]|nr:formyltetrahydrofolate deformylase [Candidatus Paceibacterota bacterium]